MAGNTIESRVKVLDQLLQNKLDSDDDSVSTALLSREGLTDVLLVLYEECSKQKAMSSKFIASFVKKYESTITELRRLRLHLSDFAVKDVIGRGHFGEVKVVRDIHTETVYAMKILRKPETLLQSEISFYKEERDIMARATSPWITQLHYAFQDAQALYLIMDFHAGGDLLSLLSRHDDIFDEKMAKFYLAEIVLATNDLHKMGYVHRDLKPENVLIDCTGHIKLADFGSAAKLSPDGLVSSTMPVGTPDYVSPELLNAMNSDVVYKYGVKVDWWSLGVCMYEMLYGKTPFTDESGSMQATYSNIMNYKACLKYPPSTYISADAKSLINSLLSEEDKRLCYTGIRKHKFFKETNWEKMRTVTPPFVPHLQSLDDTSNFEEFEKIKPPRMFDDHKNKQDFTGRDLPFVGFTYVKHSKPGAQRPSLSEEAKLNANRRKSFADTSLLEVHHLREKYKLLEGSECDLKSELKQLKLELSDKEDGIAKLTRESQVYQMDMETYIAKSNRLEKQIEVMQEERTSMEAMLEEIKCMGVERSSIEMELQQMKTQEQEEVFAQVKEELNIYVRKVSKRDGQIKQYREQLEASQKQLSHLQFRLDKERRKSRDEQKRDIVLRENMEENWQGQIEDKTSEIMELTKRVTELEDLVDAYTTQEKDYIQREQDLRDKLRQRETAMETRDNNVDICVVVSSSAPSPKKDRRMSDKIRDLEGLIEKLEKEKEFWESKEDEYRDTIEKLKCEVDARDEKTRMSTEVRLSMANQVHLYKEEVKQQREVIKELKESIQQCLSQSDDDKSCSQPKLETQVKVLEEEIESYRDDKRRLLSEVNKYKVEKHDLHFKVTELERTNSRVSCKLERVENQLEKAREKEISLRLNRREMSDIRIKLAEERAVDMEKDKLKLETKLKETSKELDTLLDKQTDANDNAQFTESRVMVENLELKTKIDDVNRSMEKLEKQITKCERHSTELEDEVASKNKELLALKSVKAEKSNLERKVLDLEFNLKQQEVKLNRQQEKDQQRSKLEREKENLDTKVVALQKEIDELKSKERSVTRRSSRQEDVEKIKQEKRFLESRVGVMQRQLEMAEKKCADFAKQVTDTESTVEKLKVLEHEMCRVKEEKMSIQDQLHTVRLQHEKNLKTLNNNSKDVTTAESKLEKERDLNDKVRADLRQELHESNLALSEARSLLSATERKEKAARSHLETEIRELKQRLFLLEKDGEANEDKVSIAVSQELAAVKVGLEKQCESLTQKARETEERLAGVQREKTASLMERHLLKDSLAKAENQCQLEAQKAEKYRSICSELESQIKDMEAIQVEHEAQVAEWNQVRMTYETAIEERESDLEGANQRLNILKQFRQNTADTAESSRKQLLAVQEKHKSDLDTIKKQMSEMRKEAQRQATRVGDLDSQNRKYQAIVEQQKLVLDAENTEKLRLRDEISKVLAENQEVSRNNIKIRQNLEEAVDKLEMIFGEKIDLENFTEALQGLHFLEKYRFESTIGQQMKLIDYLQDLWKDSVANKKNKGGKFFGGSSSKGKDGGAAMLPMLADLQETEAKKGRQLQEQLDRLRNENFSQANEILKLKGLLREGKALTDSGTGTTTIKTEVQLLVQGPSGTTKHLLTPSVKKSLKSRSGLSSGAGSSSVSSGSMSEMGSTPKSASGFAAPGPTSTSVHTPQRIHHKIPHRFTNGLNTRATKCGVCLCSVPFVKLAAKCQECCMVCHVKCATVAQPTCGLPTEYAHHFTAIMDTGASPRLPSNGRTSPPDDESSDGIKMSGWLKIPKSSKQPCWDKRYCRMEDNILLIFYDDLDANPVDTFDLRPPETDVTVHSSVSMAELPSTTGTDLPYVFRLEHEPLTTCWPGRVVYLLAPDFTEKQRWVASLEASIKRLQKGDSVKRSKVEKTSLLELSGDQRLELNCSLILSKQLTLLGADEGLFAVNVTRDPPVLTKVNQFDGVHQLKFIPQLNIVVLITGKDRRILTIDKRLIQLRLGQCNIQETQPVHHNVVDDVLGCTVFDVGVCNDAVYMCVGMIDKVLLMKYNLDLRKFCARKEMRVDEPCSCLCMADDFAIVGTDRFYKLCLEHPTLTEFVDKRDSSLAFAAFGAATHYSYPLAVVQVSPDGLPLEFLLCFHEFGVYVDNKGRRSRPADMKWSCIPLSLAYREPFLYVTYFNSVQAITVPASKQEIRGKQTSVDLTCPRNLGASMETGCVYVASSSGVDTELLSLRGKDGTIIEPVGKENRYNGRSVKKDQYRTESPSKIQGYNADKYRSQRRARRLSLTSLDSNSTVSSTSTVSSYSSAQTEL